MSSKDSPTPASKAAERLAVIVDAAERAALSVIDDAEKEARRYLLEAKGKADRIVAERLREVADQLERQIAGGTEPRLRKVELDVDESGLPTFEEIAVVADPPADEATSEDEADESPEIPMPAGSSSSGSAAARLLATQMAVSGSSRKEIEMRLRNGFEIEDTSEILDAILGPEE